MLVDVPFPLEMIAKSPSDLIFEETSPAPERLTLASYNIHRCYGRDGKTATT